MRNHEMSRASESGFTIFEVLFVLVLMAIIFRLAIARFPLGAIVCAGVDSVSENLASDMRLAKSLSGNNQKDYSVEFFSDNSAGVDCYDPNYPFNRYQIIDKSNGSVYKNETKNFPRNVTGVAVDGTSCGGASKYEEKFVFSSDGSERTQSQGGAPAAGDTMRIQGKDCQRYYDIAVTSSTGQITITKKGLP